MIALKFTEFHVETDSIQYLSETRQNVGEIIDLGNIGFSFAIEAISEDYGSIEAN